jgi:hypothetical protein
MRFSEKASAGPAFWTVSVVVLGSPTWTMALVALTDAAATRKTEPNTSTSGNGRIGEVLPLPASDWVARCTTPLRGPATLVSSPTDKSVKSVAPGASSDTDPVAVAAPLA